MFKLRPLFWPTAMMLPIVVFALGLSVWQMERRDWKLGILDRIAHNQAAPPLTLDELIKGDPLRWEYGRVRIAGTLLNDKEYYLAARSLKDNVGIQVVTPLRTDDGTIVLFDRGFVPSAKKDPKTRAEGQPSGRVELTGIVRRSQVKRYFAPDNDPAKNFWFHVDVPLMRKTAGGKPDPVLDTFFLEADGPLFRPRQQLGHVGGRDHAVGDDAQGRELVGAILAGAVRHHGRAVPVQDRARAIDRAHAPEAALQLGVRIVGDHAESPSFTLVRPFTASRPFSQ